mmetsp:Transcript_39687/g.66609  ORF Transcript_39687/g.66609 Transcript_39687/m.66609 type:complete len:159 (+) Transcript_39687:513-989(+)
MEMGADVRARDHLGHTPLHLAAHGLGHVDGGQVDTIRLLAELCGDVHAQGKKGLTPLHHAADRGNVKAVRVLVEEMGADVHSQTTTRRSTPLHAAAGEGYLEIVRVLVNMGGNVHAQSADDQNSLHFAAAAAAARVDSKGAVGDGGQCCCTGSEWTNS